MLCNQQRDLPAHRIGACTPFKTLENIDKKSKPIYNSLIVIRI